MTTKRTELALVDGTRRIIVKKHIVVEMHRPSDLNAQKKEIVDTDALMEQHKETEDLKSVVLRSVKLMLLFATANATGDLKERNKRLMKLVLTSQTLLSLEAVLVAHPSLPTTASESEKDKLIVEQGKIWELEIVIRGYEENLGEQLQKVEGDVEWEWKEKFDEKIRKRKEGRGCC
ncbi:hypothetical protein BDQ17DRAFT_1335588 [Cyathus striatus]|nr:hypothetical protein BDQ17DRAFT_1335588 [Cyathus striatus]